MGEDRNLFRMSFGTEGTTTITDDETVQGNFGVLQVLTETEIGEITDERETNLTPLNGKTLAAGTILYGKFTFVSIVTGLVRLYHNLL